MYISRRFESLIATIFYWVMLKYLTNSTAQSEKIGDALKTAFNTLKLGQCSSSIYILVNIRKCEQTPLQKWMPILVWSSMNLWIIDTARERKQKGISVTNSGLFYLVLGRRPSTNLLQTSRNSSTVSTLKYLKSADFFVTKNLKNNFRIFTLK